MVSRLALLMLSDFTIGIRLYLTARGGEAWKRMDLNLSNYRRLHTSSMGMRVAYNQVNRPYSQRIRKGCEPSEGLSETGWTAAVGSSDFVGAK